LNAPYYIFEYLWESLDYQADPLVNSYRAPTKEFLQLSFRIKKRKKKKLWLSWVTLGYPVQSQLFGVVLVNLKKIVS